MARLRVSIRTVGCRANQADSDALAGLLDPGAVEVVDDLAGADVTIVNTCCVTAQAERDCRKLARRARLEAPGARIILTGCAISGAPGFGRDLGDGVEMGPGGGAGAIEALAARINGLAASSERDAGAVARAPSRSRPLLKVQHGCSHSCAYCAVPRARGPERSTPLEAVLDKVDRIADGGFRELVLTGVQLGAWGCDLAGHPRLPLLLEKVADRFRPGRVRLSSIEPWSVDDALIDVMAGHDRVCPHLHVPLQSGDDRILASMGRGYDVAEFTRRIEGARARVRDLAFGTDVVCGLPGEDEAAFENTVAVVARLEPAYLHAFSYSPRPGTRAFGWPAPGRAAAKSRASRLIALAKPMRDRFVESQIGKAREIVIEEGGARTRGLTDNYLTVRSNGDLGAQGTLANVRLLAGPRAGELVARALLAAGSH